MSKAIFKDVVIKTDYDGVVVAWFEYSGVDRTMTHGIQCKNHKIANRLRIAALAGKVVAMEAEILTDNAGETFANDCCKVMGKYLNADLKRLGY
jgi:hypothetical protein